MKIKDSVKDDIGRGLQAILDYTKSGMPADGVSALLQHHVIGLLEYQNPGWFEDPEAQKSNFGDLLGKSVELHAQMGNYRGQVKKVNDTNLILGGPSMQDKGLDWCQIRTPSLTIDFATIVSVEIL